MSRGRIGAKKVLPPTPDIAGYVSGRVFDGVRPIDRDDAAEIIRDLDAQIAELPAVDHARNDDDVGSRSSAKRR